MNKYISVWLIIPQTNLHVGNESVVNFGVIDKAIQRNVTSGLPCINSSSLKGAIKEYLTYLAGEDKDKKDQIRRMFGSIKTESAGNIQKGSACFFDAELLAIPKPCVDTGKVYELLYSDDVLANFKNKVEVLGGDLPNMKDLLKDGSECTPDVFKKHCSDDGLPIIARNCLDNGESVNLWYEQILPAQSVLGTIFMTDRMDDLDALNGKIVQIGANATIGYGYCMFKKL